MANRFTTAALNVPNVDVSPLLNTANSQRDRAFSGLNSMIGDYYGRQDTATKKAQDDILAKIQSEVVSNIQNPDALRQAITSGQFGTGFGDLKPANQVAAQNLFLQGLGNAESFIQNRQKYTENQRLATEAQADLAAKPIKDRLSLLAESGDPAAIAAFQPYADAGLIPNADAFKRALTSRIRDVGRSADADTEYANAKAAEELIKASAVKRAGDLAAYDKYSSIADKFSTGVNPALNTLRNIEATAAGGIPVAPAEPVSDSEYRRDLFTKLLGTAGVGQASKLLPAVQATIDANVSSRTGREAAARSQVDATNQREIDQLNNIVTFRKESEKQTLRDLGLNDAGQVSSEGADIITNALKSRGIEENPDKGGFWEKSSIRDQFENSKEEIDKYLKAGVPPSVLAGFIKNTSFSTGIYAKDTDFSKALAKELETYTKSSLFENDKKAIREPKLSRQRAEAALTDRLLKEQGRYLPSTK